MPMPPRTAALSDQRRAPRSFARRSSQMQVEGLAALRIGRQALRRSEWLHHLEVRIDLRIMMHKRKLSPDGSALMVPRRSRLVTGVVAHSDAPGVGRLTTWKSKRHTSCLFPSASVSAHRWTRSGCSHSAGHPTWGPLRLHALSHARERYHAWSKWSQQVETSGLGRKRPV